MPERWTLLTTLVAYNLVLIGIGLWARRRNQNPEDFYLGGRQLGGTVAALSAAASSSSAWTLLGVSGAAYTWGFSALWLFPATLGGFVINWLWVAPRLRKLSHDEGSLTLTEVLVGAPSGRWFQTTARFGSLIILFCFAFYVAAQFQAAGLAFASALGTPWQLSIVLGVLVVLGYTLLGGFWAVSITDALQAILMLCSAILLPLLALNAVGGFRGLATSLPPLLSADQSSMTQGFSGVLGLLFVAGTLGIGLGYPGQPHVVNRFMALRDDAALQTGRKVAIGWAIAVYGGMIILGWSARVLGMAGDSEQVFFGVAQSLLPPVVAGVMTAAVLSAIMSTADSQLLVASSSMTHDWHLHRKTKGSLSSARWVTVAVSAVAACIALFAPEAIFTRVLFAWHALGSAFGPLLLVRLLGRRSSSFATLASMSLGFGLTVGLHFLPNSPGDAAERLLPFCVALAIAFLGSRPTGTAQPN